MTDNQATPNERQVSPAAYVVGAAALALLAVSHGIGAVKLLKDGEWMWMGLAFAVMAICASAAEYVYNTYRRAAAPR